MKVLAFNTLNFLSAPECIAAYYFLFKIKKFVFCYFITFLLSSCKFETYDFEGDRDGFEKISREGSSFFVYVKDDFRGDRMKQLTYGSNLCIETYKKTNYCEVYYFADRNDVPRTFPIVNRINPIGLFEMKYGSRKLKMLSGSKHESKNNRSVFIKNYSNRKSILKSIKDK